LLPGYSVAATANLWFMIASTALLTGVGWAVTAVVVEPRFASKSPEEGGPGAAGDREAAAAPLSGVERRGLLLATVSLLVTLGIFVLAGWLPGGALAGLDGPFPRWVAVIVPLLFIGFLIPGIVYGASTGALRSDRDVSKMMADTMSGMGGYIVLAFFAAQFIAYFKHTNLGEIVALNGGQLLARAELPAAILMVAFVAVVMLANLFIGSMSAKYAFLAPVFVPMFMQVGISPELTQVAYRIGDSVTNVITPLNPYMVIILVFVRRYIPRSGLGTLAALMLPYTLAFACTWMLMLVLWMVLGVELGPAGPLTIAPVQGSG
jgi:aminobenzoyl-glutamate transport protein